MMRLLLLPFSWLYGAIMTLRNFCYDAGFFRVTAAGVPVISVGNISAGGTGKTPLVEFLVRYLSKHHRRVAVLTRGYGRSSTRELIVHGSTAGQLTFRDTGDEPLQIALKFPDVPVVIGACRARTARMAVGTAGADVLILDDGFQHRALGRDLDIVIIDDSTASGSRHVLPAGLLREPLRGLRRADLVIHSRAAKGDDASDAPGDRIIRLQFQPRDVRRWDGHALGEGIDLRGKKVLGFCGIGNPSAFRKTVDSLGAIMTEAVLFRDHHPYSAGDVAQINAAFRRTDAEWIVTTEKDAIRLRGSTGAEQLTRHPVAVVEIHAVFESGEDVVLRAVDRAIGTV